ncbi:MAG TPA: prolyl oligopeptidase family serine peptidase [Thermoplasmata archaeon]
MSSQLGAVSGVVTPRIESLLSARLFVSPQVVGNRLYFVSNLSGHLSLYAMDHGGSVPEPMIPPDIVLHNPHLVTGYLYYVFPKLGKILLMLDDHGDENYMPMFVPIDGGVPEPIFVEKFKDHRVHLVDADAKRNLAYFHADSRKEPVNRAFQADLKNGTLVRLGESKWGCFPDGRNENHSKVTVLDGYTAGDNLVYLWKKEWRERKLVYGKLLEARRQGEVVKPNGISSTHFVAGDRGLLLVNYLFEDSGGLGYLDLKDPSQIAPVSVSGVVHRGKGELNWISNTRKNRYLVGYNIDGSSWVYEATFDAARRRMTLSRPIVGKPPLANGVLESLRYDKEGDRYALSFSTATLPTQIFTIEGTPRRLVRHTKEKVLGTSQKLLSSGEDASFTSYDGTRISSRLYLPPKELGFEGARPLVYYVHGGPQSQERPDFAWFSMPLIQFLILNGFAVFVPNVRGSTGYGMSFMKQVDRDWGGKDRLDHVHAMTQVLPKDNRIDVSRTAVVGRSYGGYMTLTLVGRHPELWRAGCDMFGPYDLVTFMDRIPETWKPYFAIAVGDPVKDKDFLLERSPRTHIENLECPLLVIQGKNDPRVVEQESRDLVEHLRKIGKDLEYLMFPDEGHDVLTFENRVKCYTEITEFFRKHLKP